MYRSLPKLIVSNRKFIGKLSVSHGKLPVSHGKLPVAYGKLLVAYGKLPGRK